MHIFYGKSRIIFLYKKILLTRKGIEKGFIFKGNFRNQLHWFTNSPASVCNHEPACLLLSLVKCVHSSRTYAFEIFMLKTTYAPMIYTALCIMFWMRAYPLRGQRGGVRPWNSRIFGPCEMASPRVPFGAQTSLCTGLYKSEVLK
jgi:hypothetical protein